MPGNSLDADSLTLTRFVLSKQRLFPYATGDLSQILTSIQTAVKAVSSAVRMAGLAQLYGMGGTVSAMGEDARKLDVLANDLFTNMLRSSYATCVLISEENEEPIFVEEEHRGKYIVCFDPLDGSSNIDCLSPIGSIFAIYKRKEQRSNADLDRNLEYSEVLLPGERIVAAGYALYGSATIFVLSLGHNIGVNGFILDTAIGEFILTDPNIVIPEKGNIYSINEEYTHIMDASIKEYLRIKKDPQHGKPYNTRYVGSMVADVHRTLKYGGIFLYPENTDNPDGTLRLMYEANAMAHVIEAAGGVGTTGRGPILREVPLSIHQKTPCFIGSKNDVNELIEIINKHNI